MESIKELRKICQSPKEIHNYQYFLRVRIWRTPSIYITKLFLYTPITANQVTWLMIFLGFVISSLFSFGNYWYSIVAVILLQVVYLLDAVDGEIARYRRQSSTIGVFLDLILHVTNVALPFVGITIGSYILNPSLHIVILGLLASFFSLAHLDIQLAKYYAFFMELTNYAKKGKKHKPDIKKGIKEEERKKSLLRTIFKKIINPLYDNFLITNIFFVAAIFNKLYWVLFFYGITFPLIWLIKLIYEYKAGYIRYEYLVELYKK